MRHSLAFALTFVAFLFTGCSSTPGPCDTNRIGFNCGDCLIPNNFQFLCQTHTPTSAEHAACEMSCSSTSDQAALNGILTCYNQVPAAVGACSITSENTWVQNAFTAVGACFTTDAGQPSLGCIQGYAGSFFDGG